MRDFLIVNDYENSMRAMHQHCSELLRDNTAMLSTLNIRSRAHLNRLRRRRELDMDTGIWIEDEDSEHSQEQDDDGSGDENDNGGDDGEIV